MQGRLRRAPCKRQRDELKCKAWPPAALAVAPSIRSASKYSRAPGQPRSRRRQTADLRRDVLPPCPSPAARASAPAGRQQAWNRSVGRASRSSAPPPLPPPSRVRSTPPAAAGAHTMGGVACTVPVKYAQVRSADRSWDWWESPALGWGVARARCAAPAPLPPPPPLPAPAAPTPARSSSIFSALSAPLRPAGC